MASHTTKPNLQITLVTMVHPIRVLKAAAPSLTLNLSTSGSRHHPAIPAPLPTPSRYQPPNGLYSGCQSRPRVLLQMRKTPIPKRQIANRTRERNRVSRIALRNPFANESRKNTTRRYQLIPLNIDTFPLFPVPLPLAQTIDTATALWLNPCIVDPHIFGPFCICLKPYSK